MKNLGWEPKPIRKRLEEVIKWTLDNPNGFSF